jgi:hypothetical protein
LAYQLLTAALEFQMTYDQNSRSHFYPHALEELIGYMEASDYKTSKEFLLVFRDSVGGQVTFRLPHTTLGNLVEKLGTPPTKSAANTE